MKRSIFFSFTIVLTMLFASCLNSNPNSENTNYNDDFVVNSDVTQNKTSKSIKKRPIKYFPIQDTERKTLMSLMPIPVDWKLSDKKSENIFLESPKGVKTFYVLGNQFMYSNNNYINNSFRQMGLDTKPPQSFEQVLEELKGLAGKHGGKFVTQYELPQLTQFDINLDRLFFKATPEQKNFRVVATEWIDDKGVKSIAVIHYYAAYTEMSMYWGYFIDSMEAPKEYFPTARRDYVNALLNTQVNPQWVQARNRVMQQKAKQQNAGHQRRMAALRAQGDQIIANGKQQDAMTTRTHENFMDGLLDRVNITNPSNGQTYKVDLGSNHYWINENNQLITSDNTNYNPNGDLNINGNWTEAQINY